MPVTDLPQAIGDSLLAGNNKPGLASNIFSYPGAANGVVPSTPANNGGIVLGSATAPAVDPAAAAKAASDARTATAINAGYDLVTGTYDRQLADIPGAIADAGALVGSQYDTQKGSIDSGYDRGNANLQFARDDLQTKTNRGIQDLARSIRQSFDSFSTLIGSKGAGDSSATGQLSYALQKTQAEQRTNMYQNEGDQLAQIGLKQGDLDAQHTDQLNQLNGWKAQQIISIGQQFKAQQAQIEAAKAGATKDKLMALASLNSDLVNQAVAALSGVEANHQAGLQAIKDSVAKLTAPGDPSKLSAVTATAVAPPVATAPAFVDNGSDPTTADAFSAVPYYKRLTTSAA